MKKLILLLLFICLFIVQGLCQTEGNNWYFGRYAGLNFSTNPPTILNDGHLTTGEGCTSVSSKAGDLLFYTDGSIVWDANHNIMPNGTGLLGNPSSTQSAVICPKPGTYNYALKRFDGYYIITVDYRLGPNGVRFSEVDMTLNGGTGDVLFANKNTLLYGTTTTESTNVAKHANGCDYWIIGKEVGNNTFRSYYVSPTGINLIPVISNTGSIIPNVWGSIKISPNNKLIAKANSGGTVRLQVFDLDNNTGVLTFKFSDIIGGSSYTSEFSADNKILYLSLLSDPNIYQYDLTAPNNAAFQASRTIIGTTSNTIGYRMCGIQMAPNGKIYAALQDLDYIGVINNPNTLGVGCNYVDNGQSVAGINTFSGSNMISSLGLPAFPSFFIKEPIKIISQNLCFEDQTAFQISDTSDVILIEWIITDINLFPITQSTNFELTFQFTNPGQYIVSAIVHYPCFIDSSLIDTITIVNVNPVLGNDTSYCQGQSITLDAGTGYDYYLWHNGDTSQIFLADTTGQYLVQVMSQSEDSICTKTDTINITVFPIPIAAFTFTNECFGTPINFTDLSNSNGGTITNWNWDFDNDGMVDDTTQNPSFTYSGSGTFSVNLNVSTGGGLCSHDTVQSLIIYPVPAASITASNVCLYDAAVFTDLTTINAPDTIISWQWDFGDSPPGGSTSPNPTYNYGSDGLYNVQLTVTSNNNCINSTQLTITIYPLPVMDFISDVFMGCELLCVNFSDLTTITSGAISFWDWDFGDGSPANVKNPQNCYTAIDVNTPQIATVTLIVTSSDGCVDTLSKVDLITTWPNPIALFTAEPQVTTILNPTINFIDQSLGDTISWSWDFGDGDILNGVDSTGANPTHTYSDTGTYIVEQIIVNQFSCTDTFYRTIIIQPGYIFHVPNAFTPNEDGINETFIPQGLGIDEDDFEMYIYDRWGDLIYETQDINMPWDGRANNGSKIAQQDVYVWVIFTKDMQGKRHRYLGHVALIR